MKGKNFFLINFHFKLSFNFQKAMKTIMIAINQLFIKIIKNLILICDIGFLTLIIYFIIKSFLIIIRHHVNFSYFTSCQVNFTEFNL